MARASEMPVLTGSPHERPYLLSTDDLSRMAEADLFPRGNRVYLRDGKLYEKSARSRMHSGVAGAISMTIMRRLPRDWGVWPECTIELDKLNGPLPDLIIVRGADPLQFAREDRYPGPLDIGMTIEITWANLAEAFGYRERYASAMIPACWVVDLQGKQLLACSGPRVVDGRGEYEHEAIYTADDEIPLILDGIEIARIPAAEILP